MKIIVLSDSHGRAGIIEEILEQNAAIEHVFFLGDIVRDIEPASLLYPKKRFYIVRGNCDLFADCPSEAETTLCGVTIFYCHGHTKGVKYGLDGLKRQASATRARLVLYGHTHHSDITYHGGVCYVNPGSVSEARSGRNSYAVIELNEKEIRPTIITL